MLFQVVLLRCHRHDGLKTIFKRFGRHGAPSPFAYDSVRVKRRKETKLIYNVYRIYKNRGLTFSAGIQQGLASTFTSTSHIYDTLQFANLGQLGYVGIPREFSDGRQGVGGIKL